MGRRHQIPDSRAHARCLGKPISVQGYPLDLPRRFNKQRESPSKNKRTTSRGYLSWHRHRRYDPLERLTGSTISGMTTAYGWDEVPYLTSVQVGAGSAARRPTTPKSRKASGTAECKNISKPWLVLTESIELSPGYGTNFLISDADMQTAVRPDASFS